MAIRSRGVASNEGVRAHVRERVQRMVDLYPRLIASEDPVSLGSSPWARDLERLDAGEAVDVYGHALGEFRPAGSSPSSRWRVYGDGRLEPAPPPSRT